MNGGRNREIRVSRVRSGRKGGRKRGKLREYMLARKAGKKACQFQSKVGINGGRTN